MMVICSGSMLFEYHCPKLLNKSILLPLMTLKLDEGQNSVDPDQMPRSAASDLGIHCLHKSVLTFWLNTVMLVLPADWDIHFLSQLIP